MATIEKVRLTNIIYDNGEKRYNDMTFDFRSEHSVILLQNGIGKTVFIQLLMQAIVPHMEVAGRRIKDTLVLTGEPAHIAVEWLIREKPRTYAVTAVSLYLDNQELKSLKYVYQYGEGDNQDILSMPFSIMETEGVFRPASRFEIWEYYKEMKEKRMLAKTFDTINSYCNYLEKELFIVPEQWKKIALINKEEGGMEVFFKNCGTTRQLMEHLLIPVAEDVLMTGEKINFADTFEKQRDNFKKNKELMAEIRRLKSVLWQMEVYIKKYAGHHQVEMEYDKAILSLKALKKYILTQKNQKEQSLVRIRQDLEENEQSQKKNKFQEISWKIRSLEEELALFSEEEKEQKLLQVQKQTEYDTLRSRLESIEISICHYEILSLQEQIAELQKQTERLSQSPEAETLEEELEEVYAFLHGYFEDLLTKYRNKLVEVELRLESNQTEMEKNQSAQRQLQKELNQIYAENGIKKGEIRRQNKEMQELAHLLDLSGQESIDSRMESYRKRMRELQEENSKIEHEITDGKQRIENLENETKELTQRRRAITESKGKLMAENHLLKESALDLMVRIIEELGNIPLEQPDSLYQRESQIFHLLENALQKRERAYQESLEKERLETRLYTMYEGSESFVADPALSEIASKIAGDLPSAVLGTKYLDVLCQSYGYEVEKLYQLYPFWAITLVVGGEEVEKAGRLLEKYTDKLTIHIMILSTLEVKLLLEKMVSLEDDSFLYENMVFPRSWRDNLDQDYFEQWKKKHQREAEEAKQQCREAFGILQQGKNLETAIISFFKQYPYERFRDLNMQMDKLLSKEEELEKSYLENEKKVVYQKQKIEQCERKKNENDTELNHLFIWHEKVQKYKSLQRECQNMEIELEHGESSLQQKEKEKQRLEREKQSLDGLQKEYMAERSRWQNEQAGILAKEIYQKCLSYEIKYSKDSLEVLMQRSKGVEKQLLGIHSEKSQLKEQIDFWQEQLKKARKEEETKRKKARSQVRILEDFEEAEQVALDDKLRRLEPELKELGKRVVKLSVQITELCKKIAEEREKLQAIGFAEAFLFTMLLSIAKKQIEEEKQLLKKEAQNLAEHIVRLEKELERERHFWHELEIREQRHQKALIYKEIDKYPQIVGENDFINYAYDPEKMVNHYFKLVEKTYYQYEDSLKQIMLEWEVYQDFCRKNIEDPRLLQNCIDSIANCHNYEELLHVQDKISFGLKRSIEMTEENMRQSEEDLQTFLSHLSGFCLRLLEEIHDIQYKTRVVTQSGSQLVFEFVIPKLENEAIKKILRNYIEEIIQKYDRFSGEENETSAKEEIQREKKALLSRDFNSAQLIWKALGDESIRIKCRKVNDRTELSKNLFDWETSQRWSGGEGWSKNMALFLAILNYIEEKKYIPENEGKIGRTVVLDNPFGKASSRYVLEPVFYIAKKLGYQIIALTAHAEGKFISDFFPVVYSGVSAEAADAEISTRILDFKRSLNIAHLRQKEF
ncbi:hypothetical protein EII17_09405 [Clostridiales bacterium COT073_COT-073]|nr:hypothetical protein EII17_09405 [Clostridiales bacterium COT073_COT-073]